jgi:N-carbamoyl-L-amino-acid hydrolase
VLPLDQALALSDDDGTTVADAVESLGFTAPLGPLPELCAALELHIEQGPVLEAEDIEIGVVTGVLGLRWYDLELRGVTAHAGPTPMADRRDPVRALGALTEAVHTLVERSGPSARATFARLRSEPASHNTVAERVTATLDLRHEHDDSLDDLEHGVQQLLQTVVADLGVQATLTRRDATAAVHFAPRCIEAVESSAAALGLSHRRIVSGAGHDSCYVARRVPTSMVFVPCEGGLSHNEAESITPDQAAAGASVLLGAVLELAGAT